MATKIGPTLNSHRDFSPPPPTCPTWPNLSLFPPSLSSNDTKAGVKGADNGKKASTMRKVQQRCEKSHWSHCYCIRSSCTSNWKQNRRCFQQKNGKYLFTAMIHCPFISLTVSIARWRPCWDPRGRADSLGCANTARGCSATSSTWSSTSSTCTRWAGSSPARSARRRWRTSGIWGDTTSPTTGRPLRSERKIEITWGGNIPTTCCTTHSDYPGRNWFLSIELPPKTRENSPQCNRVPTTWVRSLYSTV